MDWKAQLHFILFGLFSVVGVTLLVLALMGKSGASKQLEDAQKKLNVAAAGYVPTKEDIKVAKAEQTRFNEQVGKFGKDLTIELGDRLRRGDQSYTSPQLFYSNEVVPRMNAFEQRTLALSVPPKPPPRLGGDAGALPMNVKTLSTILDDRNPNNPKVFYSGYKGGNQNVPETQIPLAQGELNLMNDVICVLEKLRAHEVYGKGSFIFEKFDFQGFRGEPTKDVNLPWNAREFTLVVHCDPSFALALIDEITAPTQISQPLAGDGNKRTNIPMEFRALVAEMVPRPHDVKYTVGNAQRAEFGVPEQMKPEELAADAALKKKINEKLSSEEKLVLPLRYAIRLAALELNKLWTAVAVKS